MLAYLMQPSTTYSIRIAAFYNALNLYSGFRVSEQEAKDIFAHAMLAVEYLHSMRIGDSLPSCGCLVLILLLSAAHRDLKADVP